MKEQVLQKLELEGFAVIDLLNEKEIVEFKQLIRDNKEIDFEFSGLTYSLMSEDVELKSHIATIFEETMQKKEVFSEGTWDFISGSFLWKHPKTKEEFSLHQDWSYTDEETFPQCYTMWIPLQDVDTNNGCIYVIPGSHKFYNSYRSASLETARLSINENKELATHIKAIPLKKGQALLFKQALFHGSYPNASSQSRVCLTGILKDKKVPLLYYHKLNDNEVQEYKVESSMFVKDLKEVSQGNIPNNFIAQDIIAYQHELIDKTSLLNKLN